MSENAPAFRRLNSRLSPVPFPPCAHFPFRSDIYWECFVRHYSVSIYHYSGYYIFKLILAATTNLQIFILPNLIYIFSTTAMGPIGSPHAVVDPELNVFGCKRLRVIDAGTFDR